MRLKCPQCGSFDVSESTFCSEGKASFTIKCLDCGENGPQIDIKRAGIPSIDLAIRDMDANQLSRLMRDIMDFD